MLAWHHLFDDFPVSELVVGKARRVLARIVIGLKIFTLISFGANDMGIGVTPLGLLAGQCVFLINDPWCVRFLYRINNTV